MPMSTQKLITAFVENVSEFSRDLFTTKYDVVIRKEKGKSNPLVFVKSTKDMTKEKQDKKTDDMVKSLTNVKITLSYDRLDLEKEFPRYFSNVIKYSELLEKELLKEKSIKGVSFL
jgi:hypothetical protein